ncbi:MAG: peptidase S8 [Bacteroidetes bacterium]|nr:MAG: peptidase S8 [Bacteroidota bacterium]PTM13650.1 MAG: peptidase S8 [Bacteroidota bacterium]
MKLHQFLGFIFLLGFSLLSAQSETPTPKNWPQLDLTKDGFPGMSTDKAYAELLAGKGGQTVIVAIIDSGVDAEHEDLADIMWVNKNEIPGNGIDDDQNGYIDDIHGWNFIGGKDGQNINAENLEIIRMYRQYKTRFDGVDVAKLSKSARKDYNQFKEYEKTIEEKRSSLEPNALLYGRTLEMMDDLVEAIGKKPGNIKQADVEKHVEDAGNVGKAAQFMNGILDKGEDFADVYGQVKGAADYFGESYNFNWNPEYDARAIVGDDPANLNDRNYGNNDVEGPDARHGTHVAGIVAAIRGNGIGMDGVASNVRIMSVRAVPNGDERDKDVANAIRYAVDNGATVINMSFGKGESPYKAAVDDAVRYARSKDVLLVHAAGNDGKENQFDNNYPNDKFAKKGFLKPKYADNWIEIGAMGPANDENLTADFSNWSADKVDVFAPGVEIYSTVPNNEYEDLQGTSMAAPMVAGLAALLRSYFPDLTAEQVKQIIMDSSVKPQQMVNVPGEDGKATLSKLSVSGGIANTFRAVEMAIQTKGAKKKAPARDPGLTPKA